MEGIIRYFVTRHYLANFVALLILGAGLYSAYDIRKEELPDFSFDQVAITTIYPGAAPAEVEQAITLPIEHELAGLEHIRRMDSTSRRGTSIITVELRRGLPSAELAVAEINNRLLAVDLPDEVEDPPEVRHRKTSQKAVIDILLYFSDKPFLTGDERRLLQNQVRLLENRLLRRPEINSLTRSSYRAEEIHVLPRPTDMIENRIGLRDLRQRLIAAHADLPLGSMETVFREQVRLEGRLEVPELFADVPLRAAFDGPALRVADLADVRYAFEDSQSFVRTNGFESVELNVVKSSSTGILEAIEAVETELAAFMKTRQASVPTLRADLLDDESYDVRNRLKIISGNALLGFILITIVLSFFLNPRTAFWVCMGIPFSLLFTLVCANLLGYTINNMTLAAVIIAMGMLVDDAIVVSENIMRLRAAGKDVTEAALQGTLEVLGPITASILTTMAAFLPLLANTGDRAILMASIPPVVILVLLGSLIESVLILPGHMSIDPFAYPRRWWHAFKARGGEAPGAAVPVGSAAGAWFAAVERRYADHLVRLLAFRGRIFGGFAAFVGLAGILFVTVMDFSLFPRGQLQNFFIIAEAPGETELYETARRAIAIEELVMPLVGKEVVGVRSQVGYRRYRPSNEENVVSVRVELDEDRIGPAQSEALVARIRKEVKELKGFERIRIATQSFGSGDEGGLKILVQEDNDARRNQIAEELAAELQKLPGLDYVEIDRPASEYEYVLQPDRALISRLNVDMEETQATLRAALAGIRLYSFYEDNEEKHVRLRLDPAARSDIEHLLDVPATNREGYQVPLGKIVKAERRHALAEIQRVDRRRILRVSADFKPGTTTTPLAIAEILERDLFPEIQNRVPTASLIFDGEVRETREASSFFIWSVIGILLLIYLILSIQFDSLTRPLIVMTAIVPAWAAVVFIFLVHGETVFGMFTIVGALGLSGIVVNGSILLLDRLSPANITGTTVAEVRRQIADFSATRLRAVFLTTVTTAAGLLPTAYGVLGYDAMLSDMMLTLSWGLVLSMNITLLLVPAIAARNFERGLARQV